MKNSIDNLIDLENAIEFCVSNPTFNSTILNKGIYLKMTRNVLKTSISYKDKVCLLKSAEIIFNNYIAKTN